MPPSGTLVVVSVIVTACPSLTDTSSVVSLYVGVPGTASEYVIPPEYCPT